MKNSDNFVILLTATFIVSAQNKGSVFSTQERTEQYKNNLKLLLENCKAKNYVICDNSSFDFSSFKSEFYDLCKEKNKVVEYISFSSAVEGDKSAGEFEIIAYALNHSKLISEAEYVYKLTGRIIVKNINAIIRTSSLKKNYFRKELWQIDNISKNRLIECNTVLFGAKKDYLLNTLQLYKGEVSDTNNIEKIFYESFSSLNAKPFYFAREPYFFGKNASIGCLYTPNKIKWFIFNALCILRLRNCAFKLICFCKTKFFKYKILNIW